MSELLHKDDQEMGGIWCPLSIAPLIALYVLTVKKLMVVVEN